VVKLIIVGCGKEKRQHECAAKDLYTGQLFRFSRTYAETFGDGWLIASAKYGLVPPSRLIEPYDRTIDQLKPDELRQFQGWCQVDLSRYFHDVLRVPLTLGRWHWMPEIVFLAGERYINAICDGTFLANYPDKISKPLEGMGIGDRLRWLKQQVVAAGRQGRGSVQPANPNRQPRTQAPKAGGDEE
jgi:hypothetical protein